MQKCWKNRIQTNADNTKGETSSPLIRSKRLETLCLSVLSPLFHTLSLSLSHSLVNKLISVKSWTIRQMKRAPAPQCCFMAYRLLITWLTFSLENHPLSTPTPCQELPLWFQYEKWEICYWLWLEIMDDDKAVNNDKHSVNKVLSQNVSEWLDTY